MRRDAANDTPEAWAVPIPNGIVMREVGTPNEIDSRNARAFRSRPAFTENLKLETEQLKLLS